MCNDAYYLKENISFRENSTKIYNYFDELFKNLCLARNGIEYKIPTMIHKSVLEKCGYFDTFPQHLTAAAVIDPNHYINSTNGASIYPNKFIVSDQYFTPAACLHIYPLLENQAITERLITTAARVYRYEGGELTGNSRLWDFSVREIVAVGTRDYVESTLNDIKRNVMEIAKSLQLDVALDAANDHFYPTRINKKTEKVQRVNKAKYELTTILDGVPVAIASFNLHDFHFSNAFHFNENGNTVTGCIGFGIERWVNAALKKKLQLNI